MIKGKIEFFWKKNIVRYIFFGVLTVLVNMLCYFVLVRLCLCSIDVGNVISIIVALLFAYFTNTFIVFESKRDTLWGRSQEFIKFVCSRIFTMLIEVVGVHYMVEGFCVDGLVAKLVIQIVVIILNYVLSKWIIFTK